MTENSAAMQVLDRQVEMIEWWQSERGRHYAASMSLLGNGFASSEGTPIDKTKLQMTPQAMRMGEWLAASLAEGLDQAASFFCSTEMTEMITALIREQVLPDRVSVTDVPDPYGFVWFDSPILVTDVHGDTIAFRAVQWRPGKTANAKSVVIDFDDAHIEEQVGLMVTAYSSPRDGLDMDTSMGRLLEEGVAALSDYPTLIMTSTAGVAFGEVIDIDDDVIAKGPHPVQLAQAFMLLAQQYIAERTELTAPRALSRRIARSGRHMIPEITTVTLRREQHVAERRDAVDPESILWSHRWIVHGHWRRQPVGPRSEKKWQWRWIDEYVKGPESAPLVAKDQVRKLTR